MAHSDSSADGLDDLTRLGASEGGVEPTAGHTFADEAKTIGRRENASSPTAGLEKARDDRSPGPAPATAASVAPTRERTALPLGGGRKMRAGLPTAMAGAIDDFARYLT